MPCTELVDRRGTTPPAYFESALFPLVSGAPRAVLCDALNPGASCHSASQDERVSVTALETQRGQGSGPRVDHTPPPPSLSSHWGWESGNLLSCPSGGKGRKRTADCEKKWEQKNGVAHIAQLVQGTGHPANEDCRYLINATKSRKPPSTPS